MIEIINLKKEYKDLEKSVALNDINITFNDKGMYFISGKSGSGKTTLLNIISMNLTPTSGEILYDGINYKNIKNIDSFKAQYISMIYQHDNLINNLTVYENLKIVLLNCDDYDSKIDSVLQRFDIFNLKNKLISSLSGGESKRVGIARAILKQSCVILADEPTASLDEENTKLVFSALKEASKDVLVIISSHDIDMIDKYSEGTIFLDYGRVKKNTIIAQKNNNKFTLKEYKTNHKMINFMTSHIFKGQKLRRIFSIIFFTLAFFIMILSFDFITFDSTGFIYNNLKESGELEGIITDNLNFMISSEDGNTYNIKPYNYDKLEFMDMYYNEGLYLGDFRKVCEEKKSDINYSSILFNNIIIDDNLDNFCIKPTDYIIDALNVFGVLDVVSSKDSIGKSIKYNDFSFKIVDIINTSYKKYNNIESLTNIYKDVYMNKYTYLKVFGTDSMMIKGMVNNFNSYIYKTNIERTIIGKAPSFDSEIVISQKLLLDIDPTFKNDEASDIDISKTLNSKIKLDVLCNDKTINKEFSIVGIIKENYSSIMFNDTIYNDLEENSIDSYYTEDEKFLFVKLLDKDDSIRLLNDLNKNNLIVYTTYSQDIYLASMSNNTLKSVYKTVFIISIILTILISVFFEIYLLKQNKKNIGILRSLGVLKKEINICFMIETFKLFLTSLIISNIFYIIYIITENSYNKKDLNIGVNTYSYDASICAIVYVSFLLVLNITLGLVLHFMFKKDNVEIIEK